jgi:hypothetical protein
MVEIFLLGDVVQPFYVHELQPDDESTEHLYFTLCYGAPLLTLRVLGQLVKRTA